MGFQGILNFFRRASASLTRARTREYGGKWYISAPFEDRDSDWSTESGDGVSDTSSYYSSDDASSLVRVYRRGSCRNCGCENNDSRYEEDDSWDGDNYTDMDDDEDEDSNEEECEDDRGNYQDYEVDDDEEEDWDNQIMFPDDENDSCFDTPKDRVDYARRRRLSRY